MATKVSVVLIAMFLLVLPVLASRSGSAAPTVSEAVAVTEAVQAAQTAEATQAVEATEVVAATEVVEATETAMPEATPVVVAMAGDPVRGEDIFRHGLDGAPPCITCHSPTTAGRGTFSIGPGLMGIHDRAATRVEGETAEQYVEHSIRNPADFLVPGFNPVMPGVFGEKYSDQDIADLVAFLMSL